MDYCNDHPEAALNESISSTTLAYYQAVGTNANVIYNLYAKIKMYTKYRKYKKN